MLHASAPSAAPSAHTAAAPIPVAAPTSSYWLKGLNSSSAAARGRPAPARPQAPAQLPAAADVVIIGGGIAGVSTAYHLRKSRPELQVVLLEARQLSGGATGRNGGLLWPALNAPWLKTQARYGPAEAQRMMAFELQCLTEVTDFIRAHKLEEEVRYSPFRDGAYYVYDSPQEMEAELAELTLMQQFGGGRGGGRGGPGRGAGGTALLLLERCWALPGAWLACLPSCHPHSFGIHTDVQPLTRSQTQQLLRTDAFAGAVRQPGVARVWAARLVGALARMAAEAGPETGLTIAEGVRAAGVAPLGEHEP
ncbi:hypothetical protein HYH02_015101, partial [Chlamydomonas schloesseri]